MVDFVAGVIQYGLGLFFGWLVWGTKARELRGVIERYKVDCAAALEREVEIGKNLDHMKELAEALAARIDGSPND